MSNSFDVGAQMRPMIRIAVTAAAFDAASSGTGVEVWRGQL
jgi:hypothetical protein